jgi:hypothetical protein
MCKAGDAGPRGAAPVCSANGPRGMATVRFAPAAGLAVMCIGSAAAAQQGAGERRVEVSAALVSSYETNLLRLPDGAPEPLSGDRDDFRLSPALTLDLALPIGGQSAFLNGTVGYEFYARNSQLNRERILLNGGGNLNFAICGLFVAVTVGRQQSDLADVRQGNLVDDREDDDLTNVETSTAYEGQLSCGSRLGIRPSFGYRRERVENADPERASGNHRSDTFSAGVRYSRPAFGEVAFTGSYVKGRYDERMLVPGAAPAPIEIYSADISLSREIGSQLTGSASLGLTRVDPNLPDVERFRGLSWSADLTWTPGTRLRATLGASREARQSNLLSISYAIVESYSAGAQYVLNDRVLLSAGASFVSRSLRDSAQIPGAVLQSEDRTFRASAGARYAVNPRLSFALDATRDQRRSSLDQFNYDNVTVALTTRFSI